MRDEPRIMNVYRIAGGIVVSAVVGCSIYKGEGAEVGAGSQESSLSDSNDSNVSNDASDSNDSISTSNADASDETTSAGGETTGNWTEMVEMRMTPRRHSRSIPKTWCKATSRSRRSSPTALPS